MPIKLEHSMRGNMATEKEKFKDKRFLRFLHLTRIVRGNISKKETMKAYERSKFKWIKRTI